MSGRPEAKKKKLDTKAGKALTGPTFLQNRLCMMLPHCFCWAFIREVEWFSEASSLICDQIFLFGKKIVHICINIIGIIYVYCKQIAHFLLLQDI